MDYHIEKDDFEALIEVQKERVKHEVLNSYIAVRKKRRKLHNSKLRNVPGCSAPIL